MIVAALYGGLLEEGGPFGVVWIVACLSIIGFALFNAFSRTWATGGFVTVESEGDAPEGACEERVEARLTPLDELRRKGLVSTEEYRKQRERIIGSI